MAQVDKNINDYVEIILRRKLVILIPMLLGIVAGFAIAFIMPSYYRSTTLILIEGQQVPETYVQATDRTPLSHRLNTLSQQIMSRTRLEKIAMDFDLYNNGTEEGISKRGTSLSFSEEVIKRLRRNISIEVMEGGSVRRSGQNSPDAFSISYIGREPRVTMEVTNRLASLFIEENLKAREQYVIGTTEFLDTELGKAKKELERQESSLRSFKERHMGSIPAQLDANLRTLDRLQLELQSVDASIKNAMDRRDLLEQQLSDSSYGTVEDGSAANNTPQAELQRLRNELTYLLSIYKESYPDVVITKMRIKDLEALLAEATGEPAVEGAEELGERDIAATNPALYADLMMARGNIVTLQKRMADTRMQIQVYEKRVEDTPANEQRLADIKRDYDISLDNYRSLLEKKLNARLAENLEKRQKGERFRVIDPANFPVAPYKPDKLKITLMGLLGGIGLGATLTYLFEFLNPAFRKAEDFNGILDPPILSTIPRFTVNTNKSASKRIFVVKGQRGRKGA